MSADLLREAAAKMRERAEAVDDWYSPQAWATASPMSLPIEKADAEHIASWHPAVALAVADWLDECARLWEYGDVGPLMWKQANVVARIYLGRADA